ncbi:hypothetical protein CGZ93_10545 [Enemella dayhoffiae]|uniref:Uncharacterized protein n=1 Tax=Enemella dayhoffiae TaxID=2016507 RepID=A0A255H0Y3_9ACTN|nr:hypothetical protein [Enemella dayhoffiae]OYO21375.1 hypothetical protein CGZ93_10545 [Enemella dayhoffiae]
MGILFTSTVDDLLRARVASLAAAVACGEASTDEAVASLRAVGLLGPASGVGLRGAADTVATLAEECPRTAWAVLRELDASGAAAEVLELSWFAGIARAGLFEAEAVVDRGRHEAYRVEVDQLRADTYSLLGGWHRWSHNTLTGSISELWVLLGIARALADRANRLAVELGAGPAPVRRLAALSGDRALAA